MSYPATNTRLLITHREADESTIILAEGLANLPDFQVYMTREGITSAVVERGVTYLPSPPITGKVNLSVCRLLRRYMRLYHLTHTYSPGSSGLSNALLATLFSSVKNIAYRGTGARIRRTDPTYYLGILNPRVHHIVCETEHVAAYLRTFFSPSKLTVATKPFSLPWADEALRSPIELPELQGKSLRLVMVANNRGRPFKGLHTLLEAMLLLQDDRIGLTLVGDYDEQEQLFVQTSPIASNILFLGERPEAMRYMAASDVYVLPSWRDASPRVVREAMSLSLPTIVSDIPGSRDLILPGETGLLVPSQDPGALAKAILWMLEHPEERRAMGHLGRERIARDFSPERYIEIFADLFRSLAINPS